MLKQHDLPHSRRRTVRFLAGAAFAALLGLAGMVLLLAAIPPFLWYLKLSDNVENMLAQYLMFTAPAISTCFPTANTPSKSTRAKSAGKPSCILAGWASTA